MHPVVYKEFERICRERNAGGVILEVGATPSEKSLLRMDPLRKATKKIGINIDGPYRYKDVTILRGNANSMGCFEDNSFDTVLCNATLEHDKFFWKTISEIKRVTKPGGLIVIGTPGYKRFRIETLKSIARRIPLVRRLRLHRYLNFLFSATLTLQMHDAPGDYYRFSPQAFREVFFQDMKDVRIHSIMAPPIILGSGIRP
jgi:SAM-dependent methyltransferase